MQDLTTFMTNLNLQLEMCLLNIQETEICNISKYQRTTESIYENVLHLKKFVSNYTFKNQEEEIAFFKDYKPKLLSQLLYNRKVLHILIKTPPGNSEMLLDYYQNNLKTITNFFNTHQEFYQYYRLRSTYNDAIYFVRHNKSLLHLTDCNRLELEPAFTSSHDHIVAQIMANDKLEQYLKNEIQLLSHKPRQIEGAVLPKNKFQWTDTKSALVELIYALNCSQSVNNGNCDIRELATFFEQSFNIQINDIYRCFQDIKLRSTPTKYIDNLKTSLQKKIDEEYE